MSVIIAAPMHFRGVQKCFSASCSDAHYSTEGADELDNAEEPFSLPAVKAIQHGSFDSLKIVFTSHMFLLETLTKAAAGVPDCHTQLAALRLAPKQVNNEISPAFIGLSTTVLYNVFAYLLYSLDERWQTAECPCINCGVEEPSVFQVPWPKELIDDRFQTQKNASIDRREGNPEL